MGASLTIDDDLLHEAREVAGLPDTADPEDVLRRLIQNERQRRALDELEGIGWAEPDHVRPTFETLAKEFRELIAERAHTAAEELMREGRGDR